MTEPRQIAVVRSYEELLGVMRQRVGELGLNYAILDDITKFTDTYSTKILGHAGITRSQDENGKIKRGTQRGLSPQAFDAYVEALCFDLVAVENPERVRKVKAWMERNMEKRVGPRLMPNAVAHRPIIIRLSLRHMKKLGKMSCAGRMKKIPPRKRSELARNAAKARWAKPKITEITAPADVAKLSALPTDKSSGITRGANKKTSPQHQAARSEARTVRRR